MFTPERSFLYSEMISDQILFEDFGLASCYNGSFAAGGQATM